MGLGQAFPEDTIAEFKHREEGRQDAYKEMLWRIRGLHEHDQLLCPKAYYQLVKFIVMKIGEDEADRILGMKI